VKKTANIKKLLLYKQLHNTELRCVYEIYGTQYLNLNTTAACVKFCAHNHH